MTSPFRFFEFFAGGGMARAGLGPKWECLFANDFDQKKGRTYRRNFGGGELKVGDVRALTLSDIPGRADLVWGSFPCQDLSLAGGGAGLRGERSGTFWPFWNLMEGLSASERAPAMIAIENVCGTLTSHGGHDFAAICGAFSGLGYRFGAIVIDAALFVPQSRPRLFVVGVRGDIEIPSASIGRGPSDRWHSRALRTAHAQLPPETKDLWVWWSLPVPPLRNSTFSDLVEEYPSSVQWHSIEQTKQLLGMMSDINRIKVDAAMRAGRRMVGCVYKRTRHDDAGRKVQRAEVRFDDVSGCLRTPAGGSSRQVILVVDGESAKSRLISSRETARLMGIPDEYELPDNYNEAYHLTGDGVVVPVVRHLSESIFLPVISTPRLSRAAA